MIIEDGGIPTDRRRPAAPSVRLPWPHAFVVCRCSSCFYQPHHPVLAASGRLRNFSIDKTDRRWGLAHGSLAGWHKFPRAAQLHASLFCAADVLFPAPAGVRSRLPPMQSMTLRVARPKRGQYVPGAVLHALRQRQRPEAIPVQACTPLQRWDKRMRSPAWVRGVHGPARRCVAS